MEHRLACADRDHEVGVDERRMDARGAALDVDAAQVVGLAVVDDDPAPEGARPIGTEEALELVAPRSPCEAPCDEHGDPLARDPGPSELVEHGGQGLTTRIVLRGRKR